MTPPAGPVWRRGALPSLAKVAKLEVADFRLARFGRKDVNAFKKAHPSCKVEYSTAKG